MKEKILSLIYAHSLSSAEVAMWEQVLDGLPDDLAQDVLRFLETNSNGVNIMTKNLSEKVDSLRSGNLESWEKVLQNDLELIHSAGGLR